MATYNKRILGIRDPYARAYFKHEWRQVHVNQFGHYGVITGLPGHGKSYTSLLEMFMQDTDFGEHILKERYLWSAKDFHRFINQSDNYEWGTWDETGITLSSKKWHTLHNILTEDTIQIMRHKKLGVTFCSQLIGFIDNRARSLFQTYTEVKRWETQPAFWKIHRVDMNQLESKIYFPYNIFRIKGKIVKLRGIRINALVNRNIIRKFEEVHTAWKDELAKKHLKTITKLEFEQHGYDIWEMIEKVNQEQNKYMNVKGKLDKHMIMTELGIGEPRALQIIKFIEKNPDWKKT